MRNAILPATLALVSIWILPTGAWGFLCWFPYYSLLSSAEVGHYWTYSTVWRDSRYNTESIAVVGSHTIGDRTYLELSDDDKLYRCDEGGRTWQYDTGTGTEKVFWDLDEGFQNGHHSDGYVWYSQNDVEEISLAGAAYNSEYDFFFFSRGGPFQREAWASGIGPHPFFIRGYMDPWRERAGRLQESDVWDGIAELYEYYFVAAGVRSYSLVAPGLGVLYCGYERGPREHSPSADYYLESHGQVATVAGPVPFGQVKEWVAPRASNRE